MDDDVGKDRRLKFYIDCKDAGFDLPQWHQGVKIESVSEDVLERHVSSVCSTFCTNGMIGCGIAHRLLYEYHLDDPEPILIFEDDARLTLGFKRKFESIMKAMESYDFDLILLGCQSDCGTNKANSIAKVRNIHGAHAYVISSSGRHKMLDTKLNKHIDIQMSDMARAGELNAYYATPDISFADTQDMNDSLNSPPSGFPNSITTVLNNIYNSKGLPMSRHYTAGLFQLGPYPITQLHIILFIFGLFIGLKHTFIWWIFAVDLALFPTTDTSNVITTILAYTFGATLNYYIV